MSVKGYPTAPLWRRFAAMIYDSLLVLALVFLAGFINLGIQIAIYGEEGLRNMTEQGYSLDGLPFYLVLVIVIYGFFGFFWTRTGQTLGMQAWRIRILDHQGNTLSPGMSVVRFLVAAPALAIAGIGVFWVLIDKQKRSWQDIASSSQTLLMPKLK